MMLNDEIQVFLNAARTHLDSQLHELTLRAKAGELKEWSDSIYGRVEARNAIDRALRDLRVAIDHEPEIQTPELPDRRGVSPGRRATDRGVRIGFR